MSLKRFLVVSALAFFGAGLLSDKTSAQKKELPPNAPRPGDFASEDPKALAMYAMIRLSKEMESAGQHATAKVLMDQASNPPASIAARALQRVAAEFQALGELTLAAKLRKVQVENYPDPVPVPAVA